MINALKNIGYAITGIIGNPSVPTGYIKSNEGSARISAALSLMFVITAIASTFSLMWAGFSYATSSGDPGKLKQAMFTMQWAILGLVISAAGYLIVTVIAGLLGIGSLDLPF